MTDAASGTSLPTREDMMMRLAAGFALALALPTGMAQSALALPSAAPRLATEAQAPGLTRVEYYCSPGFEPSYGGTCLAVPPRTEIELFVDQPLYASETTRVVRRHHRRRHGLRELY